MTWVEIAATYGNNIAVPNSVSYYYVPPLPRAGHGLVSAGDKIYVLDGHSVTQSRAVGDWSFDASVGNGAYVLVSCPGGYSRYAMPVADSLDNQECRKCKTRLEYIINPNTDTCQDCPPGLVCFGGDAVEPQLEGSTWLRNGSIYLLTSCPAGYKVATSVRGGVFDPTLQQCEACDEGSECTTPPCTVCSPCKPGFYKDLQAAQPCSECPADTYNPNMGGDSSSSCISCPTKSTTAGKTGMHNRTACICDEDYYSVITRSGREFLCQQCPARATTLGLTGQTSIDACICSEELYAVSRRDNSRICQPCPQGLVCPDSTCAVRRNISTRMCPSGHPVVGDWQVDNSSRQIRLQGCPPGYYIYFEQCQLCPAAFYCTGDRLPPTSCASGLFTPPGGETLGSCVRAVFVVVTIGLKMARHEFTDQKTLNFTRGLAKASESDPGYVVIKIVQSAEIGSQTAAVSVTSDIATADAYKAAALVKKLSLDSLKSGFAYAQFGVDEITLISVQVTSCIPGYELLESQCQVCPSNYYCVGGSLARKACPSNQYSPPGTNSSTMCKDAIFVEAIAVLAVPQINFSKSMETRFQAAMASTALVPAEKVSISSLTGVQFRRSEVGSSAVKISSLIAAVDIKSAKAIAGRIDQASLNANLLAQDMPLSSTVAVRVISQTSSESFPVALVAGVTVGGVALSVLLFCGGYYLMIEHKRRTFKQKLRDAIKSVKTGGNATTELFPLPVEISKLYTPEQVLVQDISDYQCVLQAERKSHNLNQTKNVAIKFVVPKGRCFDKNEKDRLKQEGAALKILTSKECPYTVLLSGSETDAVERDFIGWFVMNHLEGESMDQVVNIQGNSYTTVSHSNVGNPIDSIGCIQLSRDVLAALKFLHAEGVLHCDVRPSNIIRCSKVHSAKYEPVYKLIGFGSAIDMNKTVQPYKSPNLFGGDKAYMSPEMLNNPNDIKYTTDIWSLGVSMFALVSGHLPYGFGSDEHRSGNVTGNSNAKGSGVFEQLDNFTAGKLDQALIKVIGKATEPSISKRYVSADEMHDAVFMCEVMQGANQYSVFISYRASSETLLAKILFDELNHSITPAGNRVTVSCAACSSEGGQDWQASISSGLMHSVCFFPVLSCGATAPLATLLQGKFSDPEDNMFQEMLAARLLLEQRNSPSFKPMQGEMGQMRRIYPIFVGEQQPKSSEQDSIDCFYHIQGGGEQFSDSPSPPNNLAVAHFLRDRCGISIDAIRSAEAVSVKSLLDTFAELPGCQLWDQPVDLKSEELALTEEQAQLIAKEYLSCVNSTDKVLQLNLKHLRYCPCNWCKLISQII
jgi:serine/threonine protein kinase